MIDDRRPVIAIAGDSYLIGNRPNPFLFSKISLTVVHESVLSVLRFVERGRSRYLVRLLSPLTR